MGFRQDARKFKERYDKWTLPSKFSFWSLFLAIFFGLVSLVPLFFNEPQNSSFPPEVLLDQKEINTAAYDTIEVELKVVNFRSSDIIVKVNALQWTDRGFVPIENTRIFTLEDEIDLHNKPKVKLRFSPLSEGKYELQFAVKNTFNEVIAAKHLKLNVTKRLVLLDSISNTRKLQLGKSIFGFDEIVVGLRQESKLSNVLNSLVFVKCCDIIGGAIYLDLYRKQYVDLKLYEDRDELTVFASNDYLQGFSEHLGKLAYGNDLICPIGSRLYKFGLDFNGELFISRYRKSPELIEGFANTSDADSTKVQIPSLQLNFTHLHDCGAAGRICVEEVHINEEMYQAVESMDIARSSWTDFPLFVPVRYGEDKISGYLKIESHYEYQPSEKFEYYSIE